jgi:hypothetical protein
MASNHVTVLPTESVPLKEMLQGIACGEYSWRLSRSYERGGSFYVMAPRFDRFRRRHLSLYIHLIPTNRSSNGINGMPQHRGMPRGPIPPFQPMDRLPHSEVPNCSDPWNRSVLPQVQAVKDAFQLGTRGDPRGVSVFPLFLCFQKAQSTFDPKFLVVVC